MIFFLKKRKKKEKGEEEKREAKASPKKRGTRLPDDWFLPKAWGEWALSEGYAAEAIRREAENFRDYWHSKAGPTATKLDWEATWRIWIRKSPKGQINGNGNHQDESGPTKLQRIIAAAAIGASGQGGGQIQGNFGTILDGRKAG